MSCRKNLICINRNLCDTAINVFWDKNDCLSKFICENFLCVPKFGAKQKFWKQQIVPHRVVFALNMQQVLGWFRAGFVSKKIFYIFAVLLCMQLILLPVFAYSALKFSNCCGGNPHVVNIYYLLNKMMFCNGNLCLWEEREVTVVD